MNDVAIRLGLKHRAIFAFTLGVGTNHTGQLCANSCQSRGDGKKGGKAGVGSISIQPQLPHVRSIDLRIPDHEFVFVRTQHDNKQHQLGVSSTRTSDRLI